MTNFLTANVAGSEAMQPNDQAYGYNVNRIAAVLNGTNPLPLTVGPLTIVGASTINPGPLTVQGTSLASFTGTTGTSFIAVKSTDATNLNFYAIDFTNTFQGNPLARIAMQYNSVAGSSLHFGVSNTYASGITLDAMQISPAGAVTINPGPLTVTGEIINNTSADGSPYTQARITPYRDTSNWGYIGYGTDAQMRIVYSKTVSGHTLLFGTSSAVDNTGTFTQTASLDAAGLMTLANGLTITAGGETITVGNLVITAGNIQVNSPSSYLGLTGTGTSQIAGGTTGLNINNHIDNATNIGITDAGLITFRNALSIPPSAGGTVAATSYGSVPVKIAEIVLGANTATLTFSSIPSGFRHLSCSFQGQNSGTAAQAATIQINGDTGANYNNSAHGSDSSIGSWVNISGVGATNYRVGGFAGSAAPAGATGHGWFRIKNYAQTTWRKAIDYRGGYEQGDTSGAFGDELGQGSWKSTAAVTSVAISSAGAFNIITNSIATLFGEP